ncbi:hypothetical protein BDC45DRAFT_532852 [Circinella umbellata]|nr:hypothetical protein BDC45DRAFT_532852 [Circinella umbellata]
MLVAQQNAYQRRASSPNESLESGTDQQQSIHPLRPATPTGSTSTTMNGMRLSTNNSSNTSTSRSVSFRPARFIKATPTATNYDQVSNDMKRFVQSFDNYNQKLYVEGYLFKHNPTESSRTRCFAELCGSTLSMWDAEIQSQRVMPQYIIISAEAVVEQQDKRMFMLQLNTSSSKQQQKIIYLEASDESTLLRWISAIQLACFEKNKLHLIFTQKLLLRHFDPSVEMQQNTKWDANWQVSICGSDWQKQYITVGTISGHQHQQQHRNTKLFGSGNKSSLGTGQGNEPRLVFMDTKKSKSATLTMTSITHAYAIYPESPQLIEKSCIMRIDGLVLRKGSKNAEEGHVLVMADHCQDMATGLLAIFDACKMHGRPEQLITDPTHEQSLNYGDSGSARLFLETEDVVSFIDQHNHHKGISINTVFMEALNKKLSEPIRPSGAGMRANSLPLITVACEDGTSSVSSNSETPFVPLRQRSASADLLAAYSSDNDNDDDNNESGQRQPGASRNRRPSGDSRFKFSRQVADSSDESEEEDDDEEEDDEEESDSDDEPIAKTRSQLASRAGSTVGLSFTSNDKSDSLIPDFDFGNGFDVPRSSASNSGGISTARGSDNTLGSSSPLLDTCQSDFDNLVVSNSTSTNRKSSFSSTLQKDDSFQQRQKQQQYSQQQQQQQQASSSLFGDFSLSMDFDKYMDSKASFSSEAARKYSLPSNVKLSVERESIDRQSSSGGGSSSGSSFFGHLSPSVDYARRRRSSWDHQQNPHWMDEYEYDDSFFKRSIDRQQQQHSYQRHPYDVEHGGGGGQYEDNDDNTPMIPALTDHFAPQNSLLDTYLGDQLTAKEQIEYCRATGQPLIQVEDTKPQVPNGGFVGAISRRERNRKEGNNIRVNERVQQHHVDRNLLEREKERRIFEQRQQQWVKYHQQQQIIMYNNGYMPGPPPPPSGMPMMYPGAIPGTGPPPSLHPYMAGPPPPQPISMGSPLTPTSPMSPGPHYMIPPGAMGPPQGLRPNGPRSPSMSSPAAPNSRRSSRPLLDSIEDDSAVMMTRYNNNSNSSNNRPILRTKD